MAYIPALKYHFLTPYYDTFVHFTLPFEKFQNQLLQYIDLEAHQEILDYGFGTGTFVVKLKKAFPNSSISGVEVDETMFRLAKAKLGLDHNEINLLLSDGKGLPFLENKFDLIVVNFVYNHLTFRQKIRSLKHIYIMLKPGGRFYMVDWCKPQNFIMRTLFFMVQLIDNFKNLQELINNKLPIYASRVGFVKNETKQQYNTIFGTFSIVEFRK